MSIIGTPSAAVRMTPEGPAWRCPKSRLEILRERRRVRKIMRALYSGNWKEVLLNLKKTQHRFREVKKHDGLIDALVVKFNMFRMACDLHATIIAGRPVEITGAGDESDAQLEAIGSMRERGMWDTVFYNAARAVQHDAEAAIRVDVHPTHGTTIRWDQPGETLPVGDIGPDLQPDTWERRWVVERALSERSKPEAFMRVERHRAPNGVGLIEQEAYRIKGGYGHRDVLVELAELEPVSLATALGAERAAALDPVRETGVDVPLITRLVADLDPMGEPAWLLGEHDLDLLDAMAAAISRLDRLTELHGHARVRLPNDDLVDDSGRVKIGDQEAIVDPEGVFGYVQLQAAFPELMDVLDRITNYLLSLLGVSRALVGLKVGDGAAPDTYDKLRLEATSTLARGERTSMYFGPAFGRAVGTASMVDARLPGRGYAVGPVKVKCRVSLPKDQVELARELREMHEATQISKESELVALWGERHGLAELERIRAERAEDARLAAERLSAELGFGAGGAASDGSGGASGGEADAMPSDAVPANGSGGADGGAA